MERWAAGAAVQLTVRDLSTAGWRLIVGVEGQRQQKAAGRKQKAGGASSRMLPTADCLLPAVPLSPRSVAVIGGRLVEAAEITGVLTRRPVVYEQELAHIAVEERAYVAAEMTAFLCAWLSGLACPVLNRPSPACLAGPNWRRERWVHAAAQLGIPVQPVRRAAMLPHGYEREHAQADRATAIIVGNRCFGNVDDQLAQAAQRLAAVAGTGLLAVHWSGAEAGARFLGADLWPDVSSPLIADAVFEYLSQGGAQ